MTPIFVRDRKFITFGRSPNCEYRLLSQRSESVNQKISRIQATLIERGDGWYLYPGCIAEAARGDVKPGKPGSPLYIGSTCFAGESLKMDLEQEVYLYREIDDSVLLICTNEEGLELMSNPTKIDGTQSFDLIDELKVDVERLESLVVNGFSEMRISIATLFDSERIQNTRLDTHSKTMLKISGSILMILLAVAGGSQLMDPNNRKEITYDIVKLLVSTVSGIGGTALLKDAIDKRSPPR